MPSPNLSPQARLGLPPLALLLVAASSAAGGAPVSPPPYMTADLPAFVQEARLLPTADPLGDEGDTFGASVAADGDTLVVGVPGHDLPTAEPAASTSTSGAWRPGRRRRS